MKQLTPFYRSLLILSLSFLLLYLWVLPGHLRAELIDKVVAEVNTDVITLSELEEQGASYFRKVVSEAPAEERQEALEYARSQVLESLIDKTLIAQEAARQGITVSDEEIDAAFSQVLETSGMTREEFMANLRQNDIDEQSYRENLRSQLYQSKLVNREVRSKIIITEEMILDFYDTHYTRHVDEGGYYLLQIGTSWGEQNPGQDSTAGLSADKQAALQRAERVRQLALNGEDFRELARKFSDLPSAADGGDIGIFQEEDMAASMRQAVTALEPGDISAIIETPVGFQFFKLLSSREGGIVMQAPYDSLKEEIRERLLRKALEQRYDVWIQEIRDKAYIRKQRI